MWALKEKKALERNEMVPPTCSFSEWKDFPRGLHVMVVDKDNAFLSQLRSKLEAWGYTVTTFSNEDDAWAALHGPNHTFHAILVEAPIDVGVDGFKILQSDLNVPTIMMSETENMAVMIQSITLGASDFLQKPISDEKLKIIWHHVARKAIATGKLRFSAPSTDAHQPEIEHDKPPSEKLPSLTEAKQEDRNEGLTSEDSFVSCEMLSVQRPPGLEQGTLSLLLDSFQDSSNSDHSSCIKIEFNDIQDTFTLSGSFGDVKSEACDALDESCHSCSDVSGHDPFQQSEFNCVFQHVDTLDFDENFDELVLFSDTVVCNDEKSLNMSIDFLHEALEYEEGDEAEEESLLLAEVAKAEKERLPVTENVASKKQRSKVDHKKDDISMDEEQKVNVKRRMKVEWTPELHRRFVEVVEQLGLDKAIPSKILELMGVQCLTRHNIASHLQKYRSHRKHISAREVEGINWNNKRNSGTTIGARARRDGANSCQSSTHHNTPPIQPRPALGFVPIQAAPPSLVWGHPALKSMDIWQKPHVATVGAGAAWQVPDGIFRRDHTAFPDAWGYPTPVPGTPCYPHLVVRSPLAPIPGVVNMAVPVTCGDYMHGNLVGSLCEDETRKYTILQQPKETVDVAISEVLKDPWTPLPLGLKPPSLDSVMLELQRQGITIVSMKSS